MNRKVIIINVLIIILAAEIICRIFLVNTYDAQFFRIDRIIYDAMYSNLRDMEQTKENTLDILLLGASVIHSDFASIDSIIELELGNALDRAVNVHNLSYPAHNMRDSYEKMIRLGNYNYDYLIMESMM